MENNYCASFRICQQVSEDEWEMFTRTLQLNDDTTVKQIADWFKIHSKGTVHLIITELSKPQP